MKLKNLYINLKRALLFRVKDFYFFLKRYKVKLRGYKKKENRSYTKRPIVIIGGVPRSGTTLVRALVGVHPDIYSPQKEFFLFPNEKWIKKNIDKLGVSDDFSFIFNKREPVLTVFEIIENIFNTHEKKMLNVKHPEHIIFYELISSYFLNPKFIHVIRDGRDVACSLRYFPKRKIVNGIVKPANYKNSFSNCTLWWKDYILEGLKGRETKNYLEVKYEDILEFPVDMTNKIYKFLGIKEIDRKKILGFFKDEVEVNHPQNIEVGKPMYKTSAGRWKKDMSESEKKIFKKIAGNTLIELGYEKDNNW